MGFTGGRCPKQRPHRIVGKISLMGVSELQGFRRRSIALTVLHPPQITCSQ